MIKFESGEGLFWENILIFITDFSVTARHYFISLPIRKHHCFICFGRKLLVLGGFRLIGAVIDYKQPFMHVIA